MPPDFPRVPDRPPLRTLRPVRATLLLLLRTALWTAIITASAVYCLKEGALQAIAARAASAWRAAAAVKAAAAPPPPRQAAEAGLFEVPEPERPRDPAALLKPLAPEPAPVRASAGRAPSREIPRLSTGGGNWFSKVNFSARKSVNARAEGAAPRTAALEGGVVLPPGSLTPAVRLRRAAPVPPETAARYSGVDPEADRLRAEARLKEEAARERAKKLLAEQVAAGLIVLLAGTALTLVLSRAIAAWREILKSSGTHWTLK